MATYRQLENGNWRAEVCVKGKRVSATRGTKTEIKEWATKKEMELKSSGRGELPKKTLMEAFIRYRDEVSPKKEGYRWEAVRLNAFIKNMKFTHIYLIDLTPSMFAKWRDDRLSKVSAGSVAREFKLLSSVFDVARREWQWIASSPIVDVTKPKDPPPRDRRIGRDEIDKVLLALGYEDALGITTKNQEVALAFLLALETAMRAGEILGLEWRRVNLKERYVTLLKTKNGDVRHVPLSRRAIELLNKMHGVAGKSGHVFTVKSDSLSSLFLKAKKKVLIDNLHFHDTRHEALTRLARKVDVLDLARMVGHRDPRSLMIYYNATASEIAERLD